MSLEAVKKFVNEVAGDDANEILSKIEGAEGIGMVIIGGDSDDKPSEQPESGLIPASEVKGRYVRIALANYIMGLMSGDNDDIEDAIYFKKDYLDSLKLS